MKQEVFKISQDKSLKDKTKKMLLLHLVFDEGYSTKQSAKELEMIYSTAKYITKNYRRRNGLEFGAPRPNSMKIDCKFCKM